MKHPTISAFFVAAFLAVMALSGPKEANATAYFALWQVVDMTNNSSYGSDAGIWDYDVAAWHNYTDVYYSDYWMDYALDYNIWYGFFIYDYDTSRWEEAFWIWDENW